VVWWALSMAALLASWQTFSRPRAPLPHISALVPGSAVAGSPDLDVHVAGEHFQPGASLVHWNGSPRPTQSFPGSATLLVATIGRRDLASPGTAVVTVVVVEPERIATSRPVTFVVVPAAAANQEEAERSRS
jgi:hypothetical protein